MRILTVCRAGLVRSVALADVLKLHFKPVDVIPVGIGKHQLGRFNSKNILNYLYLWAEKIIVMEARYKDKIPAGEHYKVMICDVGPDIYGSSKHPLLIDTVWQWARKNAKELRIEEHKEKL